MSFLDDIGDAVGGIFTGESPILTGILSTAMTGLALRTVTNSMNKSNEPEKRARESTAIQRDPDTGQIINISPDSENKIPVLYGEAYVPGIITDAHMSDNNQVMTYVLTLCEYTGPLLSDDSESEFTFKNIFYGDKRIVFYPDGVTAQYCIDRSGNIDRTINNLVKVYCFAGDSGSQVAPEGYTISNQNAWDIVPDWTSQHTMSDLVFVVCQVTYNRDAGVTRIEDIKVNLQNSLTLPGDCIWDMMTNTRYGAGIPQEEIYDE